MAVTLRKRTFADSDLNFLSADVAQAISDLSDADKPTVKVVQASQNVVLTGAEDYLLIDMSGAVKDVYVLLPAPASLARAVTIKITKPGKSKLYVKGSDTGSVTINGTAQVQIADAATVVPTPTGYWTV